MNNEDIKVLEKYFKKIQFAELKEIVAKKDICKIIEYEQLQAIENLIARNKELEEKVKIIDHMCLVNKEEYQLIKNNDYIPKSKVREKIEILDNIIDRLDTELAEAYIVREKLGTEEQIDNNEQYIYNMEQEKTIRHTEKYAYLKLLQEGDK